MTSGGKHADVIVIGGGIIGASIAYHLGRLGAGKIVLLERETLLGTGSTGRCAGGFRGQFSTEINIQLSILSLPRILNFAGEMDYPVDVHQDGYLFLLSSVKAVETFRRNVILQNELGVSSEFLHPEQIARFAPHIALDGILGATYGAQDGIGDPHGMTQGYAAAARRLGVEILTGVEATGIRKSSGRIEGVEIGLSHLPCGAIVNAAGPYARNLALGAGVDIPVLPERRHVYSTHPFEQAPPNHLMVIDFGTTFYFHRESGGVLMGMGNPEEPKSFNLALDPHFLEKVLEIGLVRYPGLAGAAINRAWTGLYEMTPDAHPILGRVPDLRGFYLANGFSGHGFQHAPAVGQLVAEEIVFGSAHALDISPLRLERFFAPASIRETNVV